ncbi:MAG: hypothetical protein ACU0DH_11125 [Paracoccus sp. (in: a-proteobacteria)]|uniref:hypothetical protein n=1 Tax=Paracoccus sp. TaxID=267 RepID=UPI002E8CB844|nr:hypothetical protein [Pseudomonadota bacterium]
MWEWIEANSGLVQATMAAVTALVWMVYLHIIVSGLRRQRRTEILIHLGGARDLSGRILVSNLGFEPIYVLEIMLNVWTEKGERMSSVADRTEIAQDQHQTPREATLQGPLKSGESVDIGSVVDLIERAKHSSFDDLDVGDLRQIEVTVAAVTAADSAIAAATRVFRIAGQDGDLRLCPKTLDTQQVRSRRRRNKIEAKLKSML